MNTPFIKKWIEALRSGKYKQCLYALRASKNCFCAWGVACDVYDPDSWNGCYGFLGYTHCVPKSVRLYSGLSIEECLKIEDMNDREGKNFEDIASYLEVLCK